MKKVLKVLIVLLLIALIGAEVYLYFFKENKEEAPNKAEKKEKVETKYLADLYTGYTTNGLTFKDQKEGNKVYYKTISGLKDKELENKINQMIESKVEELKNSISSKNDLVADITANFENSISMAFCSNEIDDYSIEESTCGMYNSPIDTLNIDLTTGNEVTINDVVNTKSALREQLTKTGYESLMKSIGIVCGGGPCTNPDPDYSTVEEDLLSLITKYNQDDFIFYYSPEKLFIKFKDVNIKTARECEAGEKNCKRYKRKDLGDIYVNQSVYLSEYELRIDLIKLLDNLTIYDKFKTNNSLSEKGGEKVSVKFSSPNDYSSPQMIEDENSLIDYNILNSDDEWGKDTSENIKNGLLKEMKALETKNFNIYNVFGNKTTIENEESEKTINYIYFDVRHYDMPKSIYEKNKKKIFTEKFNKVVYLDGAYYNGYEESGNKELGYEFLKNYMDRKAFFYYIYDEKGKELETEDFISFDYLKSVIPDSWLKLGGYKSKNAMIKDSYVILDPDYKYPNTLVIYDYDNTLELKYKNKTLKLANDDYEKYSSVVEKLYK